MYYDSFDIVTAHYLFYMHYHEGQRSDKYLRLCRIGRYFKPGSMIENELDDNDNVLAIYNNLVRRESDNDY